MKTLVEKIDALTEKTIRDVIARCEGMNANRVYREAMRVTGFSEKKCIKLVKAIKAKK